MNLTGDQLMMIAVAGIGLLLASFNPKITEFLDSTLSKLNPLNFFPGKKTTGTTNIHDLVDDLITYCEENNDPEGRKIVAAFGVHLYEIRMGGTKNNG